MRWEREHRRDGGWNPSSIQIRVDRAGAGASNFASACRELSRAGRGRVAVFSWSQGRHRRFSGAERFAAFLFIYEVEIIHCSRTTKSVATKL
jgi:hypothetical protein